MFIFSTNVSAAVAPDSLGQCYYKDEENNLYFYAWNLDFNDKSNSPIITPEESFTGAFDGKFHNKEVSNWIIKNWYEKGKKVAAFETETKLWFSRIL